MEKIGRIRKRLGNFKNLHFFFHRRPLAAHKQVPETRAPAKLYSIAPIPAGRASQSSSKTTPPPQRCKTPPPQMGQCVLGVYLRGEVVVLCAFYSILG